MVNRTQNSKYNKLTCLFGHHDYSKEETEDKYGLYIYLCKICQRSGHRKHDNGLEEWLDYDGKGNLLHIKWGDKSELWYDYDEKGNRIRVKWGDGREHWKANNGNWVDKKPKNWKYNEK